MANCAGLPAARIGIASPPFGLGECLAARTIPQEIIKIAASGKLRNANAAA